MRYIPPRRGWQQVKGTWQRHLPNRDQLRVTASQDKYRWRLYNRFGNLVLSSGKSFKTAAIAKKEADKIFPEGR